MNYHPFEVDEPWGVPVDPDEEPVVCETCGRSCDRVSLDWHVTDSGMFRAAVTKGPGGEFVGAVFIYPAPTLWVVQFWFCGRVRWESPFSYSDVRDGIHAAEHLARTINDIRRSAR